MPVLFLHDPEMSVDSLMEVFLRGTDIDVVTFREEESTQPADSDRPGTLQEYVQEIGGGHS